MESRGKIDVGIRIRPPLQMNMNTVITETECLQVMSRSNPGILHLFDKEQNFREYAFDYVFPYNTSQDQLYDEMVKPLVENVFNGYNSTIFAYGQTGTGKTYTMGSNPEETINENSGMIPRALKQIFETNIEFDIHISFLEIYNEKIYDLLNYGKDKDPLFVKEFKVVGLQKEQVHSCSDAQRLLYKGGRTRHTGETKQNFNSSRSHAIFIIYCRNRMTESETQFNMVDLAGTESLKKTGNEGHQMSEGISINKGLFAIGQMISALSCDQTVIPYRGSMITRILRDSLNKTNSVTLITCLSPNIDDVHETVQALDFAKRAKKVKNRPEFSCSRNTASHHKPTPNKRYQNPLIRNKLLFSTPNFYSTVRKQPYYPARIDESVTQKEFSMGLANVSSSSSIQVNNITAEELSNLKNILSKFKYIDTKDHQRSTTFHDGKNQQNENSFMDYQNFDSENKENQNENLSFIETSPIVIAGELCEFKVPWIPGKAKETKLKTSSPIKIKPRRSMRLEAKKCNLCEHKSLEEPKLKKVVSKKDSKKIEVIPNRRRSQRLASKVTTHVQKVLNILNEGSVKELQQFSTIGPKSAMMLRNYREFKGPFNAITDLKNVPWNRNSYSKFMERNFLVE